MTEKTHIVHYKGKFWARIFDEQVFDPVWRPREKCWEMYQLWLSYQ